MEMPELYRGKPLFFRNRRVALCVLLSALGGDVARANQGSAHATFSVPVAASVVASAGVIGAVTASWVDASVSDSADAGDGPERASWLRSMPTTRVLSGLVMTSADESRLTARRLVADRNTPVVFSRPAGGLLRISEPQSGRAIVFDRRNLPPGGRVSLAVTYE
jgi:hypothetical protein